MHNWPLINDNISQDEKNKLIEFLSEDGVRLTQGEKVKEFERLWSEWLGVKYSVFVNSGASGNYIMSSIIRDTCGSGEVIVPPLGWVSDIAPLVNLGLTPVFVDVSKKNLSLTAEKIKKAINKKTKAIVLVHVLGFNAMSQEIINIAKENDLLLIEDCCEAHGATFGKQRVGSIGDMSNFSFYFGHHITTIEGGMICTNNKKFYELMLMYRSHGMVREVSEETKEIIEEENKDLNPLFTFAVPGFNMRSCELNAVIGIEQMKKLDAVIDTRVTNFDWWLKYLNNRYFITNYDKIGNSNFALPLILKKKDKPLFDKVCSYLNDRGIEFRVGTAGGGNQSRQPYLKNYKYKIRGKLKNTDHIHEYGLYIGNHSDLTEEQIKRLCFNLNKICKNNNE